MGKSNATQPATIGTEHKVTDGAAKEIAEKVGREVRRSALASGGPLPRLPWRTVAEEVNEKRSYADVTSGSIDRRLVETELLLTQDENARLNRLLIEERANAVLLRGRMTELGARNGQLACAVSDAEAEVADVKSRLQSAERAAVAASRKIAQQSETIRDCKARLKDAGLTMGGARERGRRARARAKADKAKKPRRAK